MFPCSGSRVESHRPKMVLNIRSVLVANSLRLLLQLICEYVDARTLMQSLMCVNKQFYNIINDTYLWKRRILRKNKIRNVAFLMTELFDESTFNWKQCDWHLDVEYDFWSKYETNTTTTVFSGSHFSEVDAVLLTLDGNHGISASRDRSVCIWDLLSETKQPKVHKLNSHTGWVWDLDLYNEHQFLSCSWDSTVKLWDIDTFSTKTGTAQSFRNDAAVLSITSKQNFVAAGLYTPKIIVHDPRVYGRVIFDLNSHSRSIIDLCLVEDNFLVSLSEDKTLSICDLRTQETVKTINLTEHGSAGFPMCASYYENVLFVGDTKNDMYWFDCSKGLFNILETVTFEKPRNENVRYKLNSIKCTNYGSIISGGSEGVIQITTPTIPSKTIARIIDASSEITSIDYQDNTLIAGYVNSDIQVWKKK